MTREIQRSDKIVVAANDDDASQQKRSLDLYVIGSDLLPDILPGLPLKSLFRFTLVSKRWYSLICKDVKFRLFLISNQIPTVKGLVVCINQQPKLYFLPFQQDSIQPLKLLDFDERDFSLYPLQSCNGLLLTSSYWYDQDDGDFHRHYVSNPTTKKNLLVPLPHGKNIDLCHWSKPRAVCLAFDPAKSPFFKLVALLYLRNTIHNVFQIYVYSSDSNIWRASTCEPFHDNDQGLKYDEGVYCNGAIHWISTSCTSASFYYSIDDDVIKPMPDVPITKYSRDGDDFSFSSYFGESRGYLHLAMTGFKHIEIYEMNKDYSGWRIKHSVNVFEMAAMGGYDYRVVSVLSMICAEDQSFLVLRVPGKIIRFDLVSNTSQTLLHLYEVGLHITAFNYIESLCSV